MSWSCTTKQGEALRLAVAGARSQYALDWDTAGRSYGTPDDIAVPVDVCALVGLDLMTGEGVARPLGRVYVHPGGELTGDSVACRVVRDLIKIGEGIHV